MSAYIAVIADVIGSRRLAAAPDISERLVKVNAELKEELLIPFKCHRGDEIEALLSQDADFMKAVRRLKFALQPMKIRVGIGVGALDTGLASTLPRDPFQASGPAFFAARAAVELIKNSYKEQESIVIRSEFPAEDIFENLNILLRFYSLVVNRWNADQWNAVMEYEKRGSMAQAAAQLKKTYQSVQRSLKRAGWDLIGDCESQLRKQIKQLK